jgi:hypothetical protein
MKQKISIFENNVWAGDGELRDGIIDDCPAILGGGQEAAEVCYEAIASSIAAGENEAFGPARERFTWTLGPRQIEPGMRVEGGENDDHDTGTVDEIHGNMAIVRWDSLVVCECPVSVLRPIA